MHQENEAKIHFDDESHIRVLHPDKFKHTEELAEQCTSFVESTSDQLLPGAARASPPKNF